MSMLTLINSNKMTPPIAPIGLDYLAGAVRQNGFDVDLLDLCMADDADSLLQHYFARHSPRLIGISFRNADDCFWPHSEWFVPSLRELVERVRALSDAMIVLGGIGFSIFPERLVEYSGADFGIFGDGEQATVQLLGQLEGDRRFDRVPGLVWRADSGTGRSGKADMAGSGVGELIVGESAILRNKTRYQSELSLPTARDFADNTSYFRQGGQLGLETKRGCSRNCLYCVEPGIRGVSARVRRPAEVADEVEGLLARGIDVLHLCDSEFNIPVEHARAVCKEFIGRSLGESLRWYTYMAVIPFDDELARAMRRAGCVGINFTADAANATMLANYRQPHNRDDLARAVRLCRENGIAVMLDLMIGGPGETPETVAESIAFWKKIDPDCAGAAVGVRVYPGTALADAIVTDGNGQGNPNIRRRYDGPIDLFKPTFYLSEGLGPRPGQLVRDLIGGDRRFFEPAEDPVDDTQVTTGDHNYNDNSELVEAIANGQRGAYWDILRRLRD